MVRKETKLFLKLSKGGTIFFSAFQCYNINYGLEIWMHPIKNTASRYEVLYLLSNYREVRILFICHLDNLHSLTDFGNCNGRSRKGAYPMIDTYLLSKFAKMFIR